MLIRRILWVLLAGWSAPVLVHAENSTFTVSEGTGYSVAVNPVSRDLAMDLQGHLWIVPAQGGTAHRISDELSEWRLPDWSPDGNWIAAQKYVRDNFQINQIRADGTGGEQLTFGPHDSREPFWTNDGRILFASDRSGSYDIFALDLETREIQPLVEGPDEEFFPVLSPDGRWLAFVRENGSESWVVVSGNGKEQTFPAKNPRFLSWGESGASVCFQSSQRDNFYGGWSKFDCWTPETGKSWTVTDPEEDVFPSRLTWLGESGVVYAAEGRIWKRSAINGARTEIPFEAEFSVATPPVYAKKDHGFDERAPQKVLGILRPAVSPDGKSVAFTALGDLWLRGEGPDAKALTKDAHLDVDPAWSPDGSAIAYVSDRGGDGVMRLYVHDLSTSAVRQMTDNAEDLMMPAWSPDGKRIAVFMRNSLDWHAATLHLVDVDSGQMSKVFDGLFLPSAPSWSPDGNTIVTMAVKQGNKRFREGFNEFLFISPDTGESRMATPFPGQNLSSRAKHGPVWSPDGRHLAFVKESVLWKQPVTPDGVLQGPPSQLTTEVADAPSWSGDSQSITYLSLGKLKHVFLIDGHSEELPLEIIWKRAIPSGAKLVHTSRLFDGVGDSYQHEMDVLVEGNRIVSVKQHAPHPEGIEVVDATGNTVLPGLFQMHVHHFVNDGEWDGRNWLAYGITSVREPGADPYEALERRESWNASSRLGPRLFYAGIIEGNRAYYWMNIPVISEAQLSLEMDRAAALDYDFIKTYEWLDHALQRRITQFAHGLGITVASHEIYPGAMFGVDVVEHMGTSDRMETSDRISFRRNSYADVIQIMAHSGIAIVPTAAGRAPGTSYAMQMKSDPGVFQLRQFKAIPARYHTSANRLWQFVQGSFANAEDVVANEQQSIFRLAEAGVAVSAGTDGGTDSHGYSLILEIKHLAESGLGPSRALKAATIEAARATGVAEDLGSIEPGKLADLVIVEGDPLSRILDLYTVKAVMKDGNLMTLDTLLKSAGSGAIQE